MKQATKQSGQAMLVTVVFVMMASLSLMFAATNAVTGSKKDLRLSQDSRKSYFLGEAATEDIFLRLKRGLSVSQPIEVVNIGSASSTVLVEEVASGKQVTALGASGEALRNIRGIVTAGTGIAFNYGLHVGSSGVTMNSNSQVNGGVYTNGSIVGHSNSRINGDAYAVGTISSSNPTVTGVKQSGVAVLPLPVVDVEYWKAQANINNDPHTGDLNYNSGSNLLGPRKINGSLNLNSNASLTIQGPIHVTGNLNMNSNSDIYIDQSFGSAGTVVVVDGTINFNSNSDVHTTTSSPKGYILFVSTSSGTAANLNSSATVGALIHAPNGVVNVNSNGRATSIVARGITLNSNATITYDLGLANGQFTTGPGGGFEISSWGEVE